MIKIESQIESILFIKTEGVTVYFLAKFLETEVEEIEKGLESLKSSLKDRGINLLRSGNSVLLVTKPEMSEKINSLFEEETGGELSQAALQTLSIILYKKVATRGEISYIRGVDSRMSIRNLMLRGLIEKAGQDSYRPSIDTLRHMGISQVEELPRFKDISETLKEEVSKKKSE